MNPQTAQQLKERGQQAALFGAGPAWTANALAALQTYIKHLRRENKGCADVTNGVKFTFDAFRSWAEEGNHIEQPQSNNAWGALPRCALLANIISETNEVGLAQRAASHRRLVRVWRAA